MKFLSILLLFLLGCVTEPEPEDYAGVPGAAAELDNCNVCDTDKTNDCVPDCNGVCRPVQIIFLIPVMTPATMNVAYVGVMVQVVFYVLIVVMPNVVTVMEMNMKQYREVTSYGWQKISKLPTITMVVKYPISPITEIGVVFQLEPMATMTITPQIQRPTDYILGTQ